MKGENYYFYIEKDRSLRVATMSPIQTMGGEENFFGNRNIEHYWEVDRDNPQTLLDAVTGALKNDANSSSVYNIISRMSISEKDVESWCRNNGFHLEAEGSVYFVGNSEYEVKGGSPISALFNFFTQDTEIDTSNDEEE